MPTVPTSHPPRDDDRRHAGATRLVLDLFDGVPHVMVSVKDRAGRYVEVNRAFVRRTGQRNARDVIGRRARDLFPAELAASYEAQDAALLATGRTVRNHLEVIADADHPDDERWYLTSKVGWQTNDHGDVVVATSVDARLGGRDDRATGLAAAIELAHERCCTPLSVAELAAAAGMSNDRLERAMRRTLGVSPKQYVLRLRAERAAALLATTERSIAEIAATCGYYDQSQLGRQFRAHVGLTPTEFRTRQR